LSGGKRIGGELEWKLLIRKVQNRSAIVGVVGLGYVGLPLGEKRRFEQAGGNR